MNTVMAKRGRGRPRKIESNKLSDLYSDEFPEFFKIYVPATCSQTMRIPRDFIEKLGVDIPAVVRLISDGTTWEIEVKRIDEHWCFHEGWPQFAEENSLQDADFLTFSYASAYSMFFVKMFARNGCRKGLVVSRSRGGAVGIDDAPESVVDDEVDATNPCFSKTLPKSCKRQSCIIVPMKFWKEHMREHGSTRKVVRLRVENDSWEVKLVVGEDRVQLSKGWSKFMEDNCLSVGDSCTFELTHATQLVFDVTFKK